MENEIITVYWAPATFTSEQESWELLYSEPESIGLKFHKNKIPGSLMGMCPATKDILKNVFSLKSNVDEQIELDLSLRDIPELKGNRPILGKGILPIIEERESSFPGYININYHLKWLMFASEPVEMKLTAPFFPAKDICEGSLFSPGVFNIGIWYRHLNLDWHIPDTTKEIKIQQDQELAYLEFLTEKKIVFKRYVLTPKLYELAMETFNSPRKYGRNLPLQKRYDLSLKSKFPELVLSEIKKTLIDS